MKKTAQAALMLGLLALLAGCGDYGDAPEPEAAKARRAAAPDLPEAENVLGGGQVLDLGNHMVACYKLREEIDSVYTGHWKEKFAGERYIAIHDLDYDSVWYLPDVYGKILEISVQEPVGVSLRYIPDGGRDVRQVCVPIYFYERDAGETLDFDQYVHGEKSIFGAQEGLEAGPADGAWGIWEETFFVGEAEYTVLFERISPVYNPGYEFGGMQADYCLSVRDGEGYTLSRQMIVHYPVAYEEVYWLMDFSGDGFSDVAFCTDLYQGGKNGSWSSLHMLIWDQDSCRYEERGTDREDSLHVWNRDMSSLVVCSDLRDRTYCAKDMYVWLDGMWQRTRRLLRVYSETDFYDIPGEGVYPRSDGYRELIYSDGEVAQENQIEEDFYEEDAFWFAEECVWSANYEGSVRLYPQWPEWEQVEMSAGGIVINKYVRADSGAE